MFVFQIEDYFKDCLAIFVAGRAALVHFVKAESPLAAFAKRSAELSDILRLKPNHEGFYSEYCFTVVLKVCSFLSKNIFEEFRPILAGDGLIHLHTLFSLPDFQILKNLEFSCENILFYKNRIQDSV